MKKLRKRMQKLPSVDEFDPNFKRIQYCRYADDFLVGVTGSKEDAQKIKRQIGEFLQDKLRLEMSENKTLITHNSEKVRFLGYEVTIENRKGSKHNKGRRSTSATVKLLVPKDVMDNKIKEFAEKGKPKARVDLTTWNDAEILLRYDTKLRGLYNYYKLAEDVSKKFQKYYRYAKLSFWKTMARKYKSTVGKMVKKYYDAEKKIVRVRTEVKGRIREYKLIKSFKRKKYPATEQSVDLIRNIYYYPIRN